MGAEIIRMSDIKNDSRLITPRDSLIEMVGDIDAGKIDPEKLITIYVTDDGSMGYYCSNLCGSEILALLARQMYIVNKRMDD